MTPRTRTILSLVVLVPTGYGLKLYAGPLSGWVNNSFAGTAYVCFWCLALFVVWPRRGAVAPIVIGVFAATCGLEFLQLWHAPLLQAVRSTFLGRALIGTTFVTADFLYYVLGGGIAWGWLLVLARDDAVMMRADALAAKEEGAQLMASVERIRADIGKRFSELVRAGSDPAHVQREYRLAEETYVGLRRRLNGVQLSIEDTSSDVISRLRHEPAKVVAEKQLEVHASIDSVTDIVWS